MRNLIIGAVTASALLGAPAAAGAATADSPWTPVTDPLDSGSTNGSITLPAGHNCVFAVDIAVVTNNEVQNMTTLADGTAVTKRKGNLVLSFKNDTSGKTIEENVSGPTTRTVSPDGSTGTFQGKGANWLAFGPHGQANTGEPGVVITKGRVTVTFTFANNVGTAQTFSLDGTQENVCTLLS
jgi:hypothetical protein